MRIAIIILTHKYEPQQMRLFEYLSQDFLLFIHIDKRTKIKPEEIAGKNIMVWKKYKVFWGSFNQIRATLFLLEKASKFGFDRYIIISGEDIPLKSNREIIEFFRDNDREYFEYSKLPRSVWGDNGGFDRIDFFYPNSLKRGNNVRIFRKINAIIEKINKKYIIPIMRKINIKRRRNITYYGGTNWMNLTNKTVQEIIHYTKTNKSYVNSFRYTRCADEIFFQTIICNYIPTIGINNSLRYVDWISGPETPRILRTIDYEKLMKSDCLFARKFNSNIDNEIIVKIFNIIQQNNSPKKNNSNIRN